MSDKTNKERVIDYLLEIERQYVDHKLRVPRQIKRKPRSEV